jgi:hypothetical protein
VKLNPLIQVSEFNDYIRKIKNLSEISNHSHILDRLIIGPLSCPRTTTSTLCASESFLQ